VTGTLRSRTGTLAARRPRSQAAASTTPSDRKLGMSCERTSSTKAIEAITATIAAIARYVSHGNAHMRSFSRSGASRSSVRRMRSSATAMST